MSVQKVPALVLALSGKVNMTPIAWKIDPAFVIIVFEQGPKMIFNRDQVLDAAEGGRVLGNHIEPVIHNMEEALDFVKIAKVDRVVADQANPLPKRKPRK
jgi:hypothetical protein